MARKDKKTIELVEYGCYSIASNSLKQFAAIKSCQENFNVFLKKNKKRLTKKINLV